jgi:Family of unknown function (DUF6632)
MTRTTRIAALRYAMIGTGLIFTFGIFPLTRVWPGGWSWGVGHSHYLMMILGVYATLGVCLIAAARDPLANLSLIWFTVWSSVVHSAIMAVQAISDPAEHGHLLGDVPALLLVAGVLAGLAVGLASPAALSSSGGRRAA